jgi:toxin ParE1/3/4
MIAVRPFSFESVVFIKQGYRRCVCGSDSIYYRTGADAVEIMAIIGHQEFEKLL